METLKVKNLKKIYKTKKKVIEAVKNISFSTYKGEIFAILGPNGAGKTTTIKSILRLVIPEDGEISVMGINLKKHPKKALENMSAVLEGNRNIHWRLTVMENLKYFGYIRGLGGKYLKNRINEVIELVELSHKKKELAGKLSRGMQQRLAIAIALLPDTPIVLLDEPTLGLDVESTIKVREILKKLSENGKTVLLSSHDMHLVESIADRVMIINDGKIVAYDKKDNLLNAFRKKAYKITITGIPDKNKLSYLQMYGNVYHEDGDTTLEIQLEDIKELYEIFDKFKEMELELKHLESIMVNFEKVFVSLVQRGKNL
ncbi:ABC transporter ATP-binding protein [Thermosipho ferrireducens]|uniref:ABC transporter ATP-binding protein n=1 Tax=Thermosipho ferrireducens TaxID=2571116 RepID=A0ABX7SA78_9BACT|nr:ABC transporter ATP-binding protein [Thermosipho ferrireducens]QTA38825.1 ABC transporter ATP-binding protein [Thermosipho ferrireducens]